MPPTLAYLQKCLRALCRKKIKIKHRQAGGYKIFRGIWEGCGEQPYQFAF